MLVETDPQRGICRAGAAALCPEVGDVGPFGVRGLYGNARELVVRLGTADANVTFLSKGAGAGDAPSEAAIRLVRPVGFDERHPRTGFRCVREVPIR